jgi:hypothetical protein
MGVDEDDPDNDKLIIRRYELYEYTGPYDEEHEPTSAFLEDCCLEPPPGELGPFISSNMVAAVLQPVVIIPEPTTLIVLGSGLGVMLMVRRCR